MSSIHEGRNVKRFREILGLKQEILADELGTGWNAEKITSLESKAIIEVPILRQISAVLHIPVEAFQNFAEEQTMTIISNTFQDGSIAYARAEHIQCTYDPVDKVIELYERMLQQKEDMIKKLEEMIRSNSNAISVRI